MHRILAAEMLEDRTQYPPRFSLDEEVDLGIWGFGSGEKIKLDVKFQAGFGDHLYETRLSKNQEIKELADGTLHVTATVADTPQLQW